MSSSVDAVKTVLLAGPRTGKQVREATGLPRRTIYGALNRLRELGVLREQPSLRDTRQTYYWVADTSPTVVPPAAAEASA